jgi:hypothetical protein
VKRLPVFLGLTIFLPLTADAYLKDSGESLRELLADKKEALGGSNKNKVPVAPEITEESPMELFESDVKYRIAHLAKRLLCVPMYFASDDDEYGGMKALELDGKMSNVWEDENLLFANFTADFSEVVDIGAMDESRREFTLRGRRGKRRPVVDVFVAPYYNRHTLLGITLRVGVVNKKAEGLSRTERMLAFEKSYAYQATIGAPAMRGNDFQVEIRNENNKSDPLVIVEFECHLK